MTRVLLVRLSAMGDLVQSLGAIDALHAARQQDELFLLTQTTWAPLVRGRASLAGVVEHDRRGGLAAVWRTVRALRDLRCEIAIDLQGNWKSAAFVRAAGARRRIGAAGPWRQEPWSRALLTETVPIDGPRHPALVAATLVHALAPTATFAPPRLHASPEEIAAVAARLQQLGVSPTAPLRVVTVARADDPRAQRPAALARELAAGAQSSLLLLGPLERDVVVPPGVPVWRQESGSLRQLVGLGALLAANGGEAIGPDHGPIHVLAATGATTTVLFGPQDPAATAPPKARIVQHAAPPSCLPCRSRTCRHRDGPVCMDFASREGRAGPSPRNNRGINSDAKNEPKLMIQ